MLSNDNSINAINIGFGALFSLLVKTIQSDNCSVDFEIVIVSFFNSLCRLKKAILMPLGRGSMGSLAS